MEIREALDIVRKLANGAHPETGEAARSDSMYQHPQAVRALHCAIVALKFQQERERTRRFLPANAGKSWSDQEDAQISQELRHGINFESIAKTHNRDRRLHHRAAGAFGKNIRCAASWQKLVNTIVEKKIPVKKTARRILAALACTVVVSAGSAQGQQPAAQDSGSELGGAAKPGDPASYWNL